VKLFWRNRTRLWCTTVLAGTSLAAPIAAQPFVSWRYGATGSPVSKVAIAQLKTDWVVTAAVNGNHDFAIHSYEKSADSNKLIRKDAAATGEVKDVKLAGLDSSHVLAAMINSSGLLQLRVWHVDSTGHLTRLGTSFGTSCKTVSVTALSSKQAVTAVTDSLGRLQVDAWEITSSGDIIEEGSVTDVAVTQAAIAAIGNSEVFVAARNSAGDLLMESWFVSSAGTVTFQHEATAGGIDQVDISGGLGYAFTGLRNGSGKIEMILWNTDASGNIIRQESASAESIQRVAVYANVTVAEDSSGNMTVGMWGDQGTFEQEATAIHGTANLIGIAPLASGLVVTASRNSSGDFAVNVWKYGSH
jgi:hypothetical protein